MVQLAGGAAPVLEHPGAPDAHAHAGQALDHVVEDVAGEPVGLLVVGGRRACSGLDGVMLAWSSGSPRVVGLVMNIDTKREQCSCQVLVFSLENSQTGPCPPTSVRPPPSAPRTARERVREEMTAEILAVAGAHVARDGAAALSLRSIARDLGMAPSALYRYFDGRDALLSALILAAYEALADRGGAGGRPGGARAAAGGGGDAERWLAVPRALRALGPGAPARVGADLRDPGPGLRGARGHGRALRPDGGGPGAPAGRGAGGGPAPAGRRTDGRSRTSCAPRWRR